MTEGSVHVVRLEAENWLRVKIEAPCNQAMTLPVVLCGAITLSYHSVIPRLGLPVSIQFIIRLPSTPGGGPRRICRVSSSFRKQRRQKYLIPCSVLTIRQGLTSLQWSHGRLVKSFSPKQATGRGPTLSPSGSRSGGHHSSVVPLWPLGIAQLAEGLVEGVPNIGVLPGPRLGLTRWTHTFLPRPPHAGGRDWGTGAQGHEC
jgi:hypothetical protein